MTLDGSLSQREEISWPKMGILKWPLTLLGRLDDAVGCGTCLGSPRSDAEQEVLPSDDKRLDGPL